MSYVKESALFHLLFFLYQHMISAYEHSGLARLWNRFADWITGKWHQSLIVHLFYDESRLSKAWETCMLRTLLEWILNLPLRFIQWIYRLFRRPLDRSFFATLAFETGKEAFVAASWFMALILLIPYKHWNNAYSLLLFAFVLALVFLGAMNAPVSYTHLSPIYEQSLRKLCPICKH